MIVSQNISEGISLSFADMNIYHETGLVKEAKNMKISFFSKDLTRAVEAVSASPEKR